MRFVIGGVAGLAAFFIFFQLTKDRIIDSVRNPAIGTHIAAGIGAVLLMQVLRKR